MTMNAPHFLSARAPKHNAYSGATQRARVKLPLGWNLARLQEWAFDNFDTHCEHAHDCCGHWYRDLHTHDAVRVKSRTYMVTINHRQNI